MLAGVIVLIVIAALLIRALTGGSPVAISSDVKWFLGVCTGVNGAGAPWFLRQIVAFYFPTQNAPTQES